MTTLNFRDVVYSEIETKSSSSAIKTVSSARRHVVKIGGISTERITYTTRKSKTKNLITLPTDRIAIFANEYIPNHFAEDSWITYSLSVNGRSYNIVPLNSNKPGVKVLKYSTFKDDEPYTVTLEEPIKEAFLTITVRTPNSHETPYVSNLKVVTGKGV